MYAAASFTSKQSPRVVLNEASALWYIRRFFQMNDFCHVIITIISIVFSHQTQPNVFCINWAVACCFVVFHCFHITRVVCRLAARSCSNLRFTQAIAGQCGHAVPSGALCPQQHQLLSEVRDLYSDICWQI